MSARLIPFIDLKSQHTRLSSSIKKAIIRVLEHGQYIMGPEIQQLEKELALRAGVRHVVSCNSGTDALLMLLMAQGVGPQDAVLCPSFTFAATAEVIARLGATPVFVDISADDFNIAPESVEQTLASLPTSLTVRGIITVDLFGQPADYAALTNIAQRHKIWLLADAAQSFGAIYRNQAVGSLGDFTATSFFPAKPLGAYGDGGAIFTNDTGLHDVLVSLRVHGQGSDKYQNVRLGITSRLDTVQAAVLLSKLTIFDEEILKRNNVARRYTEGLEDIVAIPHVAKDRSSVWAQYTICTTKRDHLANSLKEVGIPTAIYYPNPLHYQLPYRTFPTAPDGLPVTERLSQEVLSLPFHPYLDLDTQSYIIDCIRKIMR